jgi:hypothetical protein
LLLVLLFKRLIFGGGVSEGILDQGRFCVLAVLTGAGVEVALLVTVDDVVG